MRERLFICFVLTLLAVTFSQRAHTTEPAANSASEIIEFEIHEDGSLFWNGAQVNDASLSERFAIEARKQPQPELHLHAASMVRTELVLKVISAIDQAGLMQIRFVTEPTGE